MKKIIGLYPGSFDPITNGHIDIIFRASKIVDTLIIGVAINDDKKHLFDIKVNDYIQLAGGYQEGADRNRILVIYPNGMATRVRV